MHLGKRNAIILAVLTLTACRLGPEPDAYDRYARDWLARPMPADGKMHAVHRGQIVLTPKTIICTHRGDPGFDVGVSRAALGAVDPRDDQSRAQARFGETREDTRPECDPSIPNPDRIFVRGEEVVADPYYRIWIAAMQGDALWIGRIERPDGLRPDAKVHPEDVPINDGLERLCFWCPNREALTQRTRREDSRRRDGISLSRYFFMRFVTVRR